MESIRDILKQQIEEYRRVRAQEAAILRFYASRTTTAPRKKFCSVEVEEPVPVGIESH